MAQIRWQAKSAKAFKLPSSWQQLPKGEQYCETLGDYFAKFSPLITGKQLVRLGGLSAELECKMSLPYHFVLSPEINSHLTALSNQNSYSLIQGDLVELPFESQSVDVCISANTLNFMQDPHQLLREIQRILTDDGYLFLSIFNPFSGLLFKQKINQPQNPALPFRHFLPCRIIDWLHLLNFEIIQQQTLGNLFAIVAKKQTYPLSLQPQKQRFDPSNIFQGEPVGAFREVEKHEI
ncbi:class I SAM-dependent methyltransferase [Lonepinella sp. BR2919]|uniref:class I SAM-dependent methyltransferase n=1 Tax=unclassified Lonepinella TaxID=2642006 RepID=UPI003F6E0F02